LTKIPKCAKNRTTKQGDTMGTRDKSYCESCSNLFYTDTFIEINYSDSYLLVCDTCSIQLIAEGNQRRTK
jgi:hypothetical protein